jgi:Fic family protein
MKWNWQQKDWPDFRWDAQALSGLESQFLKGSGILVGSAKHVIEPERIQLIIQLMGDEALHTSEIEGEILNRESLQSSIRRNFRLDTDYRSVGPAEAGIAEVMVNAYREFADPITHATLFDWHALLMNGRRDLIDVGRYRTDSLPMQVVSGPIHSPRVHFEAPPSTIVAAEMERFVSWFNRTSPTGKGTLQALTRAGTAHFFFECIHPFEDGNGRIGRTLVEKSLSQNLGSPTLVALSRTIALKKKAYYDALEFANKKNEITPWLLYFAQVILDAQAYTQRWVDFLIEKTKLYDRLRGELNPRQEKVLARLFEAGPDGFEGGMSAQKYIRLTSASKATATRDLQDLVRLGALLRRGELKGTRYELVQSS